MDMLLLLMFTYNTSAVLILHHLPVSRQCVYACNLDMLSRLTQTSEIYEHTLQISSLNCIITDGLTIISLSTLSQGCATLISWIISGEDGVQLERSRQRPAAPASEISATP